MRSDTTPRHASKCWGDVFAFGFALAFMWISSSATARATPYEGLGQAAIASEKDKDALVSHRQALSRARKVALETALSSIRGPIDQKRREAVVSYHEPWTGAYRVLEERRDGATVYVRVQVDVDAQRLAKYLTKPSMEANLPDLAIAEVSVDETCNAHRVSKTWIKAELAEHGIGAKGRGQLDVSIACQNLGPVSVTRFQAVRLRLRAHDHQAKHLAIEFDADGFGTDVSSAAALAGHLAVERLVNHVRARHDLVVHVMSPSPASRVRQLERAMTAALVGVDSVELVGVDPDGSVRLGIRGKLARDMLAQGLRALAIPGIALTVAPGESPDVVVVRFHQ